MGKGRARSRPGRPLAVWDVLTVVEQEAVASAAETLGIPVDRWTEVEEIADFMLSIAIIRRVNYLDRRERVPKTLCFIRVGVEFGLSSTSVQGAYYRHRQRRDRIGSARASA